MPLPDSAMREMSDLSGQLADWQRRDEAYGRMLEATQSRDDVAYERARRDFWRAK
jgi:hypothetical protein